VTVRSGVDLFRRSGEALYGPQWQRALARALGPMHPDGPREAIDDRFVRRLAAGDRSVPRWIWLALAGLAAAQRESLGSIERELAATARALEE